MVDLAKLRELNCPQNIAVTEHARQRLTERGISISEIVSAIGNGKTIKQYEDDKPYPSCLILGFTATQQPIHLVLSHDEQFIYLITAYHPDSDQWEDDWKTRK